ncbi:MAG: hypothetical protein A2Z81_08245 [Omnitrophica WOR_2 bacterium GWA2_45_18]|nr:MAG: hypothetical protein A2Z81_08245 [Omnitrophica WOR_2 bacterium GWA2_45_18]
MKKTIQGFLLFLLLFCFSTPAFADLKDGLILHYTFDADDGSTVTDQSGKGHSGTIHGAAFSGQAGVNGGAAYHFNGVSDWIAAGNLGYHDTGAISFWMKADTVENWRNPFSTDYASWDDNIRFEESSDGAFNGGGHGLGRGGAYTTSLTADRWYHVVYIWDNQYVYGYLDGDLKFKNPHPDPNSKVHPDITQTAGELKQTTLNFTNVAIGNGYSTDADRYWKGYVDEVRVYNRPLSAQEVLALFHQTDDGLVLHFTFDQNENGTVTDQSGKSNHGTVHGASYTSNGKAGGAYSFDGVDDYISVPASASLNTTDQMTIALWYRPTESKESIALEYNDDYPNASNTGVHVFVNDRSQQTNHAYSTGANLVDVTGNDQTRSIYIDQTPINEWHHLVITYDGATGRLYYDGILKTERAMDATDLQTSYDLIIGATVIDSSMNFKGRLDDIRIYNRVLGDKEVRNLHDAHGHGLVFQDFEPNNGSDAYGWAINGQYGVTAALTTERFYAGKQSWKLVIPSGTPNAEGGTGIQSQIQRWHTDLKVDRHDRLTFWVWANPSNNAPNNVAVKFFDHDTYIWDTANNKDGFQLWTTKTAQVRQWTQLTVLLTQLPEDFDFDDLDKIELTQYWPGTYYFDNIQVVSGDRAYQAFESWSCPNDTPSDCGWSWNGSTAIAASPVKEGKQSWKLTTTDYWGGTGLKSQEKNCANQTQCSNQDFWHVDLNPGHLNPKPFDRLTFWVYSLAQNGLGNNIAVQFFDWDNYFTNPKVIWSEKTADYGHWSRLSIPLSELPDDFDVTDINKIQLQVYWPGTYYFDDIRSVKSTPPTIHKTALSSGLVSWDPFIGAARYTLQESPCGPNGPWQTIYTGSKTLHILTRLSSSWLRVRWETAHDPARQKVGYFSDFSEPVLYQPKPVLIRKQRLLNEGIIDWTFIPQTSHYEIQEAGSKNGPWSVLYKGGYTINPIYATLGKWYRIRALKENTGGQTRDSTAWSPLYLYDAGNYLKAVGRNLRDRRGTGSIVTLKGFNLGNAFLLEPWMLLGSDDPYPEMTDDWTIRATLTGRFGSAKTNALLKTYQNTYLQEPDFDRIMRAKANLVRLPLYYRDIRELDANGNWTGTGYTFDHIDRIINLCADRGLYVLLDLHGAPGNQSKEFHSGRKDFNKLFDPDDDTYRQRTVELWKAIAQRYRTNTTVAGYDILNEPFGPLDHYADPRDAYEALWQLYDDIYDVIRHSSANGGAGDTNHVIVIESIPSDQDWETLPDPSTFNWKNVLYQFHYYGFRLDGTGKITGTLTLEEHQTYLIDGELDVDQWPGKVRYSKQAQYNVPVLIGEFNGFGEKGIWKLLLNTFRDQHWSWSMWSYKVHDDPSQWGMYTHAFGEDSVPDFSTDSYSVLEEKLKQYDTLDHHDLNDSLADILKSYF